MSPRSCSPGFRSSPSGCSAMPRKGRSRPISCGTGRSRKAAALAPCTRACGSTSVPPSPSSRRKRRSRMPDPKRVAVYSIPSHRSFADALAAGLIARFGKEPLALARGRVLLPNNRAVRALTEAFVRASGTGLLLPRLIPVGDPEIDERIGGALESLDTEPLPPAIDTTERLLRLGSIIGAEGSAEDLRLASDLARTLDALLVEEVA